MILTLKHKTKYLVEYMNHSIKKIVITNAVMVNNGDAGLVLGLYQKLTEAGYDVTIATHNYQFARKTYPNIKFIKDIVSSKFNGPRKIFALIALPFLFLTNRYYMKSEIIVGAPGGYINSYYGFFWKLYVNFIAKVFQKKTIMYAQSVGPLSYAGKFHFRLLANFFDKFLVRDEQSHINALQSGIDVKRIIKTCDAIFLHPPLAKTSISQDGNDKVGVSVRTWNHDKRDSSIYENMMSLIIIDCVNHGFQVELISSCQGVPGYIDDSLYAKEIYNSLPLNIRKRVKVIEEYYTFQEMQHLLGTYEFVVGTRLHVCLVSLLIGTPAFNISYEVKGKEAYQYLNMSKFSIDYNQDEHSALSQFREFLAQRSSIVACLEEKLSELHTQCGKDFDATFKDI